MLKTNRFLKYWQGLLGGLRKQERSISQISRPLKTFSIFIFLMALPFIFFVSDSFADTLVLTEVNENNIAGYISEQDINFSATRKNSVVEVNLRINDISITLVRGIEERVKEFQLFGYDGNGEITLLDAVASDNIDIIFKELIRENIGNNLLGKTLLNSLNLLSSWPSNMPLYVYMDEEKIKGFINATDKPYEIPRSWGSNKSEEQYKAVGDSSDERGLLSESLCNEIGNLHRGTYIDGYEWAVVLHLWEVPFDQIVGGDDCFGRCGVGCVGDGIPYVFQNDVNRYTQACFNHDGCVKSLGYNHGTCNLMFSWAIDDFFNAIDCTTLTVASSNPSSGVSITVSPSDNSSQGNGTTQFTRGYNNGTSVTLTAPSTSGGNNFSSWNGCNSTSGSTCYVTMDANKTVTASYVTPTTSCSDSYEPNDSSTAAYGPLSSGSSYSGKICTSTDADWFKVTISSPGTISLSLTVPSSNDYELELYGPSDTRVAVSANGTGISESISYSATTTGTYYIRIYGYSGSYNATDPYTLTYNFTQTTTTVRTLTVASSNPSSGVSITVSPSDNSSQGNGTTQFTRGYNNGTSVTLTAPSTSGGNNFSSWNGCNSTSGSTCYVTMDANKTVTASYVTPTTSCSESEPNNSSSSANPLTLNVGCTGYISTSTDVDWFDVYVSSGTTISFKLTVPSGIDYDMELYGPSSTNSSQHWLKNGTNNGAGQTDYINSYTTTATGYFAVRVFGYAGAYSTTSTYTITRTQ